VLESEGSITDLGLTFNLRYLIF